MYRPREAIGDFLINALCAYELIDGQTELRNDDDSEILYNCIFKCNDLQCDLGMALIIMTTAILCRRTSRLIR